MYLFLLFYEYGEVDNSLLWILFIFVYLIYSTSQVEEHFKPEPSFEFV